MVFEIASLDFTSVKLSFRFQNCRAKQENCRANCELPRKQPGSTTIHGWSWPYRPQFMGVRSRFGTAKSWFVTDWSRFVMVQKSAVRIWHVFPLSFHSIGRGHRTNVKAMPRDVIPKKNRFKVNKLLHLLLIQLLFHVKQEGVICVNNNCFRNNWYETKCGNESM